MDKLKAISALSLALLLATPALAEPLRLRLDFGGSLDWAAPDSIDTALGFGERQTLDAKLRLMWQGGNGPWRFELQSLLAYQKGDNIGFAAAMAGLAPPPPPPSFFDLTSEISASADSRLSLTLDRLSVTYSSQNLVLKAGRQAVTWGSGMVFRPSDIIAPFAPNAIDTSFKPGVEMLYGQYLFDNGNDIELAYVPRRAAPGGALDWNASTLALRSSLLLGELDGTVMLARDRGDTLVNLTLGGGLGGAAWNVELGQWFLSDGNTATSFLANISNSGTLGGMNITYFAEYFRNGFGVDPATPLDALPAPLASRLASGQIFNAGRDFLALGGQIGLTDRLNLTPSVITSLNDGSVFGSVQASLSLSDNFDISFSASKGFGPNGSEFGGRETSAGSGVYLRPPTNVSLNLTRYF